MREFEGIERDSEQLLAESEQQRAIMEILDSLDRGERLNSGQMLLLRWFCGIPQVKDLRQMEMAVGGDN